MAEDVTTDDVCAILDALGLDIVHARPYSLHDIVHREIVPAIKGLRARRAEGAPRARIVGGLRIVDDTLDGREVDHAFTD